MKNVLPISPKGTVELDSLVKMMTTRRCHLVAESEKRRSAREYRRLWPRTAQIPTSYVTQHHFPLLVDLTIPTDQLARCGRIDLSAIIHKNRKDLVKPPTHQDGSPCLRYIVFFRFDDEQIPAPAWPAGVNMTFTQRESYVILVDQLH